MTDPMTLREQVARAIYDANPEMFIPASDATIPVPYDDIPDEWRANQLAAADTVIALITEACANVADLYGEVNLQMAGDSVLLDPVLNRRFPGIVRKSSEELMMDGAIHSSAYHTAQHIAQRIRQMGKP